MDLRIQLVRHDIGEKPPGTFIDDEYVLHVVQDGSFTFQIEDSSFSVRSGDVVLIPPLTLHALRDQRDINMTVIHFLFRGTKGMPFEAGPVVSPDADIFENIERYTGRLLRESVRQSIPSKVLSEGLLQCIIGLVLEADDQFRKRANSNDEFVKWRTIENAVNYIRDQYSNPDLSVTDVCDHVGLSYNYFCTVFHRYTNDTPHNFISRMRLRAAKDRLWTDEMNVGEIAVSCGFKSAAQFSKVFKKQEGLPPKQWSTSMRRSPGRL
jgi:AraC-like DNA-binding protein